MKIQYIKALTLTALSILLVVPIFVFTASYSHAAQNIIDGDLVKTATNPDIYIVKIISAKKFKRLILNPAIFNSYGHLKWSDVKTVEQIALDEFKLSELVIEVNADSSVADPKVYRVVSSENSDVGERSWLNLSASEFEVAGYDWDSLYKVNHNEASPSFYPTKTPLTYQDIINSKNASVPAIQNTDISSPRYLPTEGGAIYDTVLKKFISPTPSSQTFTTTQSSAIVVGSISLSASPSTIPADGKSTSIITATVKDTNNNVAPNQTVYFSYGNVTVAAITNASGVVNITYATEKITSSSANIITVTITAKVDKVTNSIEIKQVALITPILYTKNYTSFYGGYVNGERKISLSNIWTNTPIKQIDVYKGTPLAGCPSNQCFRFDDLLSAPKITGGPASVNSCYTQSVCGPNAFVYEAEFIDFFGVDEHITIWVDVIFENGEKIGLVSDSWGIGLWKSEIFK